MPRASLRCPDVSTSIPGASHRRLERVGNDTSCDGHVDRWDRDAILMAQEEAQQGVEIADAGTTNASQPVTVGTAGQILDGGPPKKSSKGKRGKH